tara:strand:- start:209 stop:382 length:174 start_codon:yes stop_codon:yes gene_type:complete
MYTVTYFEVRCDEEIADYVHEYFDTHQEAQAFAKSFEDWDDIRVDYVSRVTMNELPF